MASSLVDNSQRWMEMIACGRPSIQSSSQLQGFPQATLDKV